MCSPLLVLSTKYSAVFSSFPLSDDAREYEGWKYKGDSRLVFMVQSWACGADGRSLCRMSRRCSPHAWLLRLSCSPLLQHLIEMWETLPCNPVTYTVTPTTEHNRDWATTRSTGASVLAISQKADRLLTHWRVSNLQLGGSVRTVLLSFI